MADFIEGAAIQKIGLVYLVQLYLLFFALISQAVSCVV